MNEENCVNIASTTLVVIINLPAKKHHKTYKL